MDRATTAVNPRPSAEELGGHVHPHPQARTNPNVRRSRRVPGRRGGQPCGGNDRRRLLSLPSRRTVRSRAKQVAAPPGPRGRAKTIPSSPGWRPDWLSPLPLPSSQRDRQVLRLRFVDEPTEGNMGHERGISQTKVSARTLTHLASVQSRAHSVMRPVHAARHPCPRSAYGPGGDDERQVRAAVIAEHLGQKLLEPPFGDCASTLPVKRADRFDEPCRRRG